MNSEKYTIIRSWFNGLKSPETVAQDLTLREAKASVHYGGVNYGEGWFEGYFKQAPKNATNNK